MIKKKICILLTFGTRPEAIKLAPVVQELWNYSERVETLVCVTAQHREMLDQVLDLFGIEPDIDLDLMEENQSLPLFTSRAMTTFSEVLEKIRPNIVLVQGDTTSAMVASLAAFYQKIPVGHVEAGLRTRNRYSPFPEEINRRLISQLATYHFAPTCTAAKALRAEGIVENIFITGNTVIDALLMVANQPPSPITRSLFDRLNISTNSNIRILLVTAHRRENFGQPLESICTALREIVLRNPDVQVIYPVHMNPNVRKPVYRILSGHRRIHLVEPLPYETFVHLMKSAYLILTDSGGIQEEAPALGKPVLVMRHETERSEAIEAGTVKVVGTDSDRIIKETERLLYDMDEYRRMSQAVSPYGDGQAAQRIVAALLGRPVQEFIPSGFLKWKENLAVTHRWKAEVVENEN